MTTYNIRIYVKLEIDLEALQERMFHIHLVTIFYHSQSRLMEQFLASLFLTPIWDIIRYGFVKVYGGAPFFSQFWSILVECQIWFPLCQNFYLASFRIRFYFLHKWLKWADFFSGHKSFFSFPFHQIFVYFASIFWTIALPFPSLPAHARPYWTLPAFTSSCHTLPANARSCQPLQNLSSPCQTLPDLASPCLP